MIAVPVDQRVKLRESEKRDKYLDIAFELKIVEHESDGDTNCNSRTRHGHQRIGTGTIGLVDKWTSIGHSNDRIVEMGQNTKKSSEDLKRLAVTQTSVENYQLKLVWKTLKWVK